MTEMWKIVPNYDKQYSVSTLGNVRNNRTRRLLKISVSEDKNGSKYKKVGLYRNGKRVTHMLARLVWLTYRVEFPQGKSVIKFLNKDALDCTLNNLYPLNLQEQLEVSCLKKKNLKKEENCIE